MALLSQFSRLIRSFAKPSAPSAGPGSMGEGEETASVRELRRILRDDAQLRRRSGGAQRRQEKREELDPALRAEVRIEVALNEFFRFCSQKARDVLQHQGGGVDDQALMIECLKVGVKHWPQWSVEEASTFDRLTRDSFFSQIKKGLIIDPRLSEINNETSLFFVQLRATPLDETTCRMLCEPRGRGAGERRQTLLAIAQHTRSLRDDEPIDPKAIIPVFILLRVFRAVPEIATWVHAQLLQTLQWQKENPEWSGESDLPVAASKFTGTLDEVARSELWSDALGAQRMTLIHPLYLTPWSDRLVRALEASHLPCPAQALSYAVEVLSDSNGGSTGDKLAYALVRKTPLNQLDEHGQLAMVEQVRTGTAATIDALLALGSDPFLCDAQGHSAVSVASGWGSTDARAQAIQKSLAPMIAAYQDRESLAAIVPMATNAMRGDGSEADARMGAKPTVRRL